MVATEALAAVGAEITWHRPRSLVTPKLRALCRRLGGRGTGQARQLAPPQREMVVGLVRMCLHQAPT